MRLFLLLLFVPVVALAQTFQEKVTVSYVEVPVTVTRAGAPVRNLTRANFELREDGQPRSISSFEAIDFTSAGLARAVSTLHPASHRNFLLLFDLSYSHPKSIARAQTSARDFIARTMGARDRVAIGAIDLDRGFRFLTAFTTDRVVLGAAVSDPRNFRAADPLQIGSGATLDIAAGGAAPMGETAVALDNMPDIARLSDRLDDSARRTRIRRQLGALAIIARSLEKLAGKKHVVLLSEGFDPRLVTGRDATEVAEQFEEDEALTKGELWKVDSDKRFGSLDVQASLESMAEAFRRSDAVLHAVDIQGIRVQNDVRGGATFNSNAGLFLLSDATGGMVFRNSNDITADFDRLSRLHEVVYVLGFEAPVSQPGKYRELKVKLVNVPDARVEHRGGYYEDGSDTAVERTLTTAEVIVNDIAQDDIAMTPLVTPFPTGRDRSLVPVILEIAGGDVARAARNGTATTEIFVYAFDAEGLVQDSLYQRVVLDLAQVGARLEKSGLRFYGTLHVPPGLHVVKSLVRVVESDAKGFARTETRVPAAGDVTLAPPLFTEDAGEWLMVKATRDGASTPYPFVLHGEPFIPSARPVVRAGQPRQFMLFVYNADPDEVEFDVAPEAQQVSRTVGDGVTKYLFTIPSFPAGAKQLDVSMRRKGSSEGRTTSVPIEVR
jgi:VWFA-related protein